MAYIFFFFCVIILSYLGKRSKVAVILLFILSVLFLGFRQNVGTDYQNYEMYFSTGDVLHFEPANQLLYYIAILMGDEVKWTFFLYALISYIFLFAVIKRYKNPIVSIFLIIFTFTFLSNGIRQAVAIIIFLYACRFIKERRLLYYLFFILLASLFHTSIIITLPLYFIANKSLDSKYYVLAYIVSFVFTQMNLSQIVSPVESVLSYFPQYSRYVESHSEGYFSAGILFEILLNCLLLTLSLKHNFHKRYPIIFNMFFLTILLFNMRIAAYILNRVVVIFSLHKTVVAALLVSDKGLFYKYRKVYLLIIIIAYILLLCQAIFLDKKNCMIPYQTLLF